MEKVVGGGACLFGFCFAAATTGRLGECVREGGEEIGESWVLGGGVLPRKGRLPRDGARYKGSAGSGLEGRELLLRGGAMVSLNGSGVSECASIEGIRSCCGDPMSLPSSSSSLNGPVAGTVSSARIALCGGRPGLDLET